MLRHNRCAPDPDQNIDNLHACSFWPNFKMALYVFVVDKAILVCTVISSVMVIMLH